MFYSIPYIFRAASVDIYMTRPTDRQAGPEFIPMLQQWPGRAGIHPDAAAIAEPGQS